MKKAMVWLSMLLVTAAWAAALSGCGSKVPAGDGVGASSTAVPPAVAPSAAPPVASAPVGDDAAEIPTRQDADGLVQVRIEDRQAIIRLEPQRWDALYGPQLQEFDQMFDGIERLDFSDPAFFMPITRPDDTPIRDVCIGTVPGFSEWSIYSFPVPMVMLLRADGRVEAAAADPFASRFSSEGMLLNFLENVETLYADADNSDGRGDPSIYAVCTDGLRYNLAHLFPHTFSPVTGVQWACEVEDLSTEPAALTIQLELFEDDTASLSITGGGGLLAEYVGSYAFVLAEEQAYPPPTLVLDLTLQVCHSPAIQARGDIKGAYYYQLGVQDAFLYLWHSFGDALYEDASGAPVTEYGLFGYGPHPEDDDATTDADFSHLYDGDWVTELEAASGVFEGYQGVLRFVDETRVAFDIMYGSAVVDAYGGHYSIIPGGETAGSSQLVLDLALDWTAAEGGAGTNSGAFPRREIKGTYLAEMTNHPELYLWLNEGDGLYNNQFNGLDGPQTAYTFALVPHAGEEAQG